MTAQRIVGVCIWCIIGVVAWLATADLEPTVTVFLACLTMPTAAALSGLYVLLGGNEESTMAKNKENNPRAPGAPMHDAPPVERDDSVTALEMPTVGRIVHVPCERVGGRNGADVPALVVATDVHAQVFEAVAFGACTVLPQGSIVQDAVRRIVVDCTKPGTWRWPPRSGASS